MFQTKRSGIIQVNIDLGCSLPLKKLEIATVKTLLLVVLDHIQMRDEYARVETQASKTFRFVQHALWA